MRYPTLIAANPTSEKTIIKPMKTSNAYIKIALPLLAAAILTATSGRADTYSWTNFQSDIPGVAQHTDPNLVNPWGMAVSTSGTIWVSDNGTGVSTLYHQDGTASSLVVEIPRARRNRGTANPTGIVFNSTSSFQVTKNGTSAPALFIFVSEDGSKEDDVACAGCGFVNVFDTSGNFLRRLVSNGNLNAPWGLTLTEDGLWVGNFGDGLINVYDPVTGTFIETLMRADGTPLQFDGLWDMLHAQAGGSFFTGGIADGEPGLVGLI